MSDSKMSSIFERVKKRKLNDDRDEDIVKGFCQLSS